MSLINKTIYPVIPDELPEKVVKEHYTLTAKELDFTVTKTINSKNQIYFSILFKTYQKLAYFIPIHKCPENIVTYIAKCLAIDAPTEYELFCYDKARIKDRHIAFARDYFKVKLVTNSIILDFANIVAGTKSSLVDIINGTIEELIANAYELPRFNLLELNCIKARNTMNNGHYDYIYNKVTKEQEKYIKKHILIYGSDGKSKWSLLKQEPPKISINNIKSFAAHLEWLKKANITSSVIADIPQIKLDSLYEGGYGGIAYYHIANTYIALFSNFITCGVYEGRYLLDGIEENETELKPEYVHGDTHSQSFVIFALAYLLGIKVMPRIRNIQDLIFYKANKTDGFGSLDAIFKNASINWRHVVNNVEEMFRVAISIKEGKIKPSLFLNKLAYCGGRNKLYLAFRELGRVLRTIYLLQYINDFELRKEVHAATCKSEEFNEFVNWIAFADNIIKSNHRVEQRKFIKYNHLVANMTMLYTVHEMSKVINTAPEHGIIVTENLLKNFSPYRREHLTRLGKYEMNIEDSEKSGTIDWSFGLKSQVKANS